MNDSTFLRNLARRGKVVLLADGTALPVPTSVMDDDSAPGSTFYIELISPEGVESGDRRQFEPGTITWRELPIPLMWQWQLEDGHNSAVIVGRIDYIEETENGLGNARGVFDSGPWGREAERLVRAKMLRGVSGDYSNFTAEITDAADESSGTIKDNAINVTGSKLVSATLVSKPAFEGCYITVDGAESDPDDDSDFGDDADADPETYDYDDGVIEANVPITASALIASGMKSMVDRLERLELLEYELEIGKWQLTASAARDRVEAHRLSIEAERARARVNAARNVTAAFHPLDKGFLSRKAKLQPRDKNGRWIEMGSIIRWHGGDERIGGVSKGGKLSAEKSPFRQGRVKHFNADTGEYQVEPLDGSPSVQVLGRDAEVVKAVIPSSPEEAAKLHSDSSFGGGSKKYSLAGTPGFETDGSTPDDVKKGLDSLSEILNSQLVSFPVSDRKARRQQKSQDAADAAAAEDARLWPDRETLGRQLFNNLGHKNETWDKDGEKYMAAGDRLRKIASNPLISKKRQSWIMNTYGKDAAPISPKIKSYRLTLDDEGNNSLSKQLSDLGDQHSGNEVGPLAKSLTGIDMPDENAPSSPESSDGVTQAVDGFESAIKSAGFDPADTEIADHLDELKNNPETRDSMQISAVEDWLESHRDEMTDADQAKIDSALDGVKKSLDGSASDLTVPDSFDTPAPEEPSPSIDPLDQLAKDFENSPEGERAKNLARLEQFLKNAEEGKNPEPVKPLVISGKDGDLTKSFHGLGLDNEDDHIRADEGEHVQAFEQRVLAGDSPSAQEWTNMNNDITLYKDELPPSDYAKLKQAWDSLKTQGGAPPLEDSPDWKNDSRRLTDPSDAPAETPTFDPATNYTPNPAGDFGKSDRVTWTEPDGTPRSGKVTGGLGDGSSITVLPDDSDTTIAKAPADLSKGKSLDDELADLTQPGSKTDDTKKGE